MIQFGLVSQLDATHGKAKVRLPHADEFTATDELGMESPWMPILFQWATGNQSINMPKLNEQVAFWLEPEGGFGVILGGIYSPADAPPSAPATAWHRRFPDGTILEYDPAAHLLKADVKGDVSVLATGQGTIHTQGNLMAQSDATATLKGAAITLDGPVHATGTLLVSGKITGSAGEDITGNITATGEITAAAIPLTTHKHTGVMSGGSDTGLPVP